MNMTKNVGNTDRVLRVIIGVVIAVWGAWSGSWLGLIAILPLTTAAMGWCPLYSLLGMSTCPVNTEAPTEQPPVNPTVPPMR